MYEIFIALGVLILTYTCLVIEIFYNHNYDVLVGITTPSHSYRRIKPPTV
jgi:hypothetical protein